MIGQITPDKPRSARTYLSLVGDVSTRDGVLPHCVGVPSAIAIDRSVSRLARPHRAAASLTVETGGSSAALSAPDLLNLASQEISAISETAVLPCNPLP